MATVLQRFPKNVFYRQGLESTDAAGWQSFNIAGGDLIVTSVEIIVKGIGSGAPGFQLLDGRVVGEVVDNPTDTITVSRVSKFSSLTVELV